MGNSKSQLVQDGNLEINLSNFKLQRVVGKGSYGKVRCPDIFVNPEQVRVVELRNNETKTKESYALKYIRKIDCVRADFAHNIIRERRILQELEHPLIVNLRYAFQDEEFMYMVSDLMYVLDGHG
jgi:serine/threonine kinase 32